MALGWFSVGLGASQILAPEAVARLIGSRPSRRTKRTMRMFGVRELTAGMGILASSRPGWLWARVVGDVVDITLLSALLGAPKSERRKSVMSLASVVGVTLLDVKTARDLGRLRDGTASTSARGIHVVRAITVNRAPEEVYRFWHDFPNLPRFMAHLESVEVVDGRSHWRAKGPAGTMIEWDADITVDRPGEIIAWHSRDGADVPNSGSVIFLPAPGGRGTEVRVELRYRPPAGSVGAAIAKLFGEEPGQQIQGDLRRLKQVLETGEVVHSDASVHRGRHPARPPESADVERKEARR
jgi:uncharacterized membrane protein